MLSRVSARVGPVVTGAPLLRTAWLVDEGRFFVVVAFFPVAAVFDVVDGVRRFRDPPLAGSDSVEGRGEGRLGGGDEGAADWDGVAVAVLIAVAEREAGDVVEGALDDLGVVVCR
eukprot:2435061-Pyramimonas_sp.AAC.1